MENHRRHPRLPNWAIPSIYAVAAFVTGLTFPRFEPRLLPQFESGLSTTAAVAIYSSVGTGMLALTGIVFSLVFVMVQFSAVAHSPRLVLWIARDRVIWHSLGVFTATFIYSMAAIAWLDRDRSGRAQKEIPPNTPKELPQETFSRLFKRQLKIRLISGAEYVVVYVAMDENRRDLIRVLF